jgi:hypothetical protein
MSWRWLWVGLGLSVLLAPSARASNSSGRVSVLDRSENQYSATTILETASGSRIRTVKRDSFGGLYWAKDFTSSRSLFVGQVQVDASGNVYVATTQLVTASAAPIFTLLKYTSTGTLSWSRTFTDSTYRLAGVAGGLALDTAGNAYVIAWGEGGTSGTSSRLLKYNSAGTLLFNKLIQPQFSTRLGSIKISSTNAIYLSGEADPGNPSTGNLFLAKYDTSGNQLWQRLDAVGPQVATGDLALDASGQPVAVTASSTTSASTLFAEKVNTAGTLLWSQSVAANGFRPVGAIVDSLGDVVVCGPAYGTTSGLDNTGYQVAKLDGVIGTVLWNTRWTANFTNVTAIAEEASGSYLTVGDDVPSGVIEIRLVQLDNSTGSVIGWFFYQVTSENHGYNVLPSSIAGDFYVTGRAFWSGNLFPLNWKVSGSSTVYSWITTTTFP